NPILPVTGREDRRQHPRVDLLLSVVEKGYRSTLYENRKEKFLEFVVVVGLWNSGNLAKRCRTRGLDEKSLPRAFAARRRGHGVIGCRAVDHLPHEWQECKRNGVRLARGVFKRKVAKQ